MHIWGDDWFKENGADLDKAINYCTSTWRRYGRIGTSFSKEKYGTFRHNVSFYSAWWPVHELVKPGYVYYQWPKWLQSIEIFIGMYIITPLRLHRPIIWWQSTVYNYAIQKVCKKYPKIVDELVSDSCAPHLIKPGIFGKIDGQAIHDKYWTTA